MTDTAKPDSHPKLAAAIKALGHDNPEVKQALVVLGPQTIGSARYTAIDARTGQPAQSVPLDKDWNYAPGLLTVQVDKLAAKS